MSVLVFGQFQMAAEEMLPICCKKVYNNKDVYGYCCSTKFTTILGIFINENCTEMARKLLPAYRLDTYADLPVHFSL